MGDMERPTGSAIASSSSVPSLGGDRQAPTGRGRGAKGSASSSGIQNRTYDVTGRGHSTLSIFSHNVYTLIDPGSTLSYVTPLVAGKFKRTPELLHRPLEVATPIGKSIIARRVYHDCIVTICGRDTLAGPIELEMVEFDVIMGMDWLGSCYATVDCQTKRVCFHFPNEAILEWEGNVGVPRENVVADALSRMTTVSTNKEYAKRQGMAKDLRQLANLGVRLLETPKEGIVVHNVAESLLVDEVKEKQYQDPLLHQCKER
ncbi:unnamed protein product [Withania somnifera]